MHSTPSEQLVLYSDFDRGQDLYGYADKLLFAPFVAKNATFAIERMPFVEEQWTKEDVLFHFNATRAQRKSGQYNANLILMRNSAQNRRMIEEWVALVAKRYLPPLWGSALQ